MRRLVTDEDRFPHLDAGPDEVAKLKGERPLGLGFVPLVQVSSGGSGESAVGSRLNGVDEGDLGAGHTREIAHGFEEHARAAVQVRSEYDLSAGIEDRCHECSRLRDLTGDI